MRKMQKIFALTLAALTLMVLFAGCGGSGNTATTTASTTTASADDGTDATTEAAQAGYGGVMPEDQIEYINYEAAAPLIAEGYDNVTMTMGVVVTSNRPCNATDNWLWDYCEGDLGITIDADQIMDTEKQNLLFASNMLPDLMMGFDLGTGDFMKYGHNEQMLLNYAPYMEAGYMPALKAVYEADPACAPNYTVTADGDMYAMPRLTDKDGIYSWYIRYAWYDVLDMVDPYAEDPYEGYPTSVSELTEDLITFRDTDPATFGVDQIMPISGIYKDGDWGNPMGLLMESFGYLYRAYFRTWTSAALYLPSLHQTDDNVQTYGIGTNDEYLYEYLSIQNDWYNENLFPVDYFTADSAQHSAWNGAGYAAVEASGEGKGTGFETPGAVGPEWTDGPVLKSSVRQITPYSANYPVYGTTAYFTATACEYPELACRFWDLFWHDEYQLLMRGRPIEGLHNTYGKEGMIYGDNPINDEAGVHTLGWYFPSEATEAGSDYWYTDMTPTYMNNCHNGAAANTYYNQLAVEMYGDEYPELLEDTTANLVGYERIIANAEKNYKLKEEQYANGEISEKQLLQAEVKWTEARYAQRGAYCGTGFEQPLRYVYRDQDTTDTIADITAVLNPYIMEQTALFITGRRPLDEVASFQEDINSMGLLEYEAILEGEYEAFLTAYGLESYLPAPVESN